MRATIKAVVAATVLVFAAIVVRTALDGSAADEPVGEAVVVTVPAPRPCGQVLENDANGYPLDDEKLALVREVHDAACRRAPDDLQALMDPRFGGRTAAEAIAGLLAWTPKGIAFDSLAAVLETPGKQDQGGLSYCTPHGVMASFARGTITNPGGWTDFTMIRNGVPCV